MSAAQARGCIAELMFPHTGRPRVGKIHLHEHQSSAVRLIESAIAGYGGALLCDPVGTGKTFTALAVAAAYPGAIVVAPALLRTMWLDAARAAGVVVQFVSHEALSRSGHAPTGGKFLIVDEAHHARNPVTKRFAALSRLAHRRDVLLLTATPIHNRRGDIATLLSLFLGHRASALTAAECGALVIRRADVVTSAGLRIPRIVASRWLEIEHDDSVVDAIAKLPPPLPLREGRAASSLIIHSLVRLWASSDAALRGALRRRSQRALALIAALESGTYPTGVELSAWATGEDAVQLAFPELVATPTGSASELLPIIRAHADGVDRLLKTIGRTSSRDESRATILRDIRRLHQPVRMVAFSQYEETVSMYFRRLAPDGGVAALSGRAGHVSGGTISRREIIERFAPRASGRPEPRRADAVSLLLTTDLMSEGVNLQDAGVVIHLDLPFTHARLEQRAGRLARLGSRHDSISSYVFRPPATAEALARIERLVEMKLSLAEAGTASSDAADQIRLRLRGWGLAQCDPSVASAVKGARPGFLAAIRIDGVVRLLGSLDGRIRDDPDFLLECIEAGEGIDDSCDEAALEGALRNIESHIALTRSLGPDVRHSVRRGIHRRVRLAVRNSRLHSRSRLAFLAREARRVIDAPGGSLSDRELTRLAHSDLPDPEWLEALASHGVRRNHPPAESGLEILAVLLFRSRSR